MDDLVAQTEKASNKLLHLTSTLASALKIEGKLENLTFVETAVDNSVPGLMLRLSLTQSSSTLMPKMEKEPPALRRVF